MDIKKKTQKTKISRRNFLKGLTAAGAVTALDGYSGNARANIKQINQSDVIPPKITGRVIPGAAPHNCGGRCVTKAYVENGVIRRFVTDENPDVNLIDGNGQDKPQMRACVRCRSNRQRFYRSDRILSPLKQAGQRGDIKGFVKISWDQAASEIAEKLLQIKNQYGPESLYNHYASGDGNEICGAASCSGRLLNLLGGQMVYRSDYSWPSLEHTSWFFFGQNFYFPPGKSRQDAFNADVVVVWSGNFAESIWGTNSGWYLQQLKEMGKEVIVIDSRFSMTASTQATRYIPVMPGTDAALINAIIYELITKTWDKDGKKIGNILDEVFILKYVHGFFDDFAYKNKAYNSIPKGYHSDVNRNNLYIVPDGSSLSAMIMGSDDRLVKAGLNGSTSIYPDKIGYNNYNPLDKKDYLKNKMVGIYGNVPKSPKWAESVSGVSEEQIRELADIFSTKKVTIWLGGGFQRQSEGEQGPLLCYTLGVITKNFGENGRHVGVYGDRQPISFSVSMPSGENNVASKFSVLYDTNKLSVPNYTPVVTRTTFPVFLWTDVAKNGGSGKSMWNDGQIKKMPTKMKALLNFGGNCLVNQCGDYNTVSQIVKDRNNIELIVVADQFMTPTAKFADYILPAATAYEKDGACTGWLAGDSLICMNKAVEPLGEAKDDYGIVSLIADKLGLKNQFTEGKSVDDWRREVVEPILKNYNAGMDYDEWKEKGLFHLDENFGIFDPLANYRKDPSQYPLSTPSGKFEVFCQAMVEDYEARGYNNMDSRLKLKGPLYDGKKTGRFVYPIPMFIPMLEGLFANGEHPDPEGLNKNFPYLLNGWHFMFRSHSTHNNNAYLNELYKKDNRGEKAFLDYERKLESITNIWEYNIYESVWINTVDADSKGITTGDIVILESPRGSIFASAVVTERVRKGVLAMGQGGWANGDNEFGRPDIGGAINVLTKLRPSRICQGMTLGADTRVNIRKA